MPINLGDIADGALVNATALAGRRVAVCLPRAGGGAGRETQSVRPKE